MDNEAVEVNIRIKGSSIRNSGFVGKEKDEVLFQRNFERENFKYDNFYGEEADNFNIFESSVKCRLNKFLEGKNVTFYFFGKKDGRYSLFENNSNLGLGLMSLEYILEQMSKGIKNNLSMSFLQVHQEKVII